jgi:hypothetical protein
MRNNGSIFGRCKTDGLAIFFCRGWGVEKIEVGIIVKVYYRNSESERMSEPKWEFIDEERRAEFYSGRMRELVVGFAELPDEVLRQWPRGLKILDLGGWPQGKIPKLPKGLEEFYISNHDFQGKFQPPGSLRVLEMMDCRYERVSIPRGIEELKTNCIALQKAERLDSLKVLIWEKARFTDFNWLPKSLRVLKLNGDCAREKVVIDWLPPTLEYCEIASWSVRRIESLPDGLIYLSIGVRLEEIPPLPASLKVLRSQSNWAVTRLPTLPRGLKKLIFRCCRTLVELPELPDGLRCLNCDYTGISTLPRLPDSIRHVSLIGVKSLTGSIEIPSQVRSLYASDTGISEIIYRGGIVPPLTRFHVGDCPLIGVPELPESIRHIFVGGCGLRGAWRGYFPKVNTFWCWDNELTELPDIARAAEIKCYNNKLRFLPEAVRVCEIARFADNPLDFQVESGDTAGASGGPPSLMVLAGEFILATGLAKHVEVVELREYLGGFHECPACGRKSELRRHFVLWDEKPVTCLRCWRCKVGALPPVKKLECYGEHQYNKYLRTMTRCCRTRRANLSNWLVRTKKEGDLNEVGSRGDLNEVGSRGGGADLTNVTDLEELTGSGAPDESEELHSQL